MPLGSLSYSFLTSSFLLTGLKEPFLMKGQTSLFHRTVFDGMVQASQAEIKPETDSALKIDFRFPVLARPQEPLILRRGNESLTGHFVKSLE